MRVSLECPECASTLTAAKMLPSGTVVNCPGCHASLEFNVHSDVGGDTVITLSRAETAHESEDATGFRQEPPPRQESTPAGTFVDQTCFACGKPINVDSQFCAECGVSLLSKCPQCQPQLTFFGKSYAQSMIGSRCPASRSS